MKNFIYKLFKIKRYFIVSYHYMTKDRSGGVGFGTGISHVDSGEYFSIEQFRIQSAIDTPIDPDTIAVIAVTELSKRDYMDYIN